MEEACATCLCHSHLSLGTSLSKQNNQNKKKTQNNNKNEICTELLGGLLRHFSSQCWWEVYWCLWATENWCLAPSHTGLEARTQGRVWHFFILLPGLPALGVTARPRSGQPARLPEGLLCELVGSFSLGLCGTLQGTFQASTRIKPVRVALELGELLLQW